MVTMLEQAELSWRRKIVIRSRRPLSALVLLLAGTTCGCGIFDSDDGCPGYFAGELERTDARGQITGTEEIDRICEWPCHRFADPSAGKGIQPAGKVQQVIGVLPVVPAALRLGVFPNPVLSGATVQVAMPERAEVAVFVADRKGRVAEWLFDGTLEAGMYRWSMEPDELLTPGDYLLYVCASGAQGAMHRAQVLRIVAPRGVSQECRQLADTHWDGATYLAWRLTSRAIRYNQLLALPCSTQYSLKGTLDGCPEMAQSLFYDYICRYDQFVVGWDDAVFASSGEAVLSPTAVDSVETVSSSRRQEYCNCGE